MKKKHWKKVLLLVICIFLLAPITCTMYLVEVYLFDAVILNHSSDMHLCAIDSEVDVYPTKEGSSWFVSRSICSTEDELLCDKKYSYSFPFKDTEDLYWSVRSTAFDNNCTILTYTTDGMHTNRLQYRITEQLIYLNDATETADVLYESMGTELVLYGTPDSVLRYSFQESKFQYLSLVDGQIKKEVPCVLKERFEEYYFEIDETQGVLTVVDMCNIIREPIEVIVLPLTPSE